jgi:hypothetical protein
VLKDVARADREREAQDQRKVNERDAAGREQPNAFERFGAELEALFIGMPEPVTAQAEAPKPAPNGRPVRPGALAPIEADLARRLMEEGIVIRGHDIARVVGLMAGTEVVWEESPTA